MPINYILREMGNAPLKLFDVSDPGDRVACCFWQVVDRVDKLVSLALVPFRSFFIQVIQTRSRLARIALVGLAILEHIPELLEHFLTRRSIVCLDY